MTTEPNLFQKHLIPEDSLWVRSAMQHAADLSHEGFLEAHLLATAEAIRAVACSILNTPLYPVRGVLRCCVEIINLNLADACVILINDFYSGVQSLIFSCAGVVYVTVGFFFPETTFPYFAPHNKPVPPNPLQTHLDSAQARITALNAELQQARDAIATAQGQLTAETTRYNALVAANRATADATLQAKEQELASARSEITTLTQTNNRLSGELSSLQKELNARTVFAEEKDRIHVAAMHSMQQNALQQLTDMQAFSDKQLADLHKSTKESLAEREAQMNAHLEEQLAIFKQESDARIGRIDEASTTHRQLMTAEKDAQSAAHAAEIRELQQEAEMTIRALASHIEALQRREQELVAEIEHLQQSAATAALTTSIDSLIHGLSPIASTPLEESADLGDSGILIEHPTTTTIPTISHSPIEKITSLLVDGNHPSKVHKYRVVLDAYTTELTRYLQSQYPLIENYTLDIAWQRTQNSTAPLIAQTHRVLTILLNRDGSQPDPRKQVPNLVLALRELIQMPEYKNYKPQDQDEESRFCYDLIRRLIFIRWTQTHVFNYLKGVTDLTLDAYEETIREQGKQVPERPQLNAEEFLDLVSLLNREIKAAPQDVKKPTLALWAQMGWGSVQLKDFTLDENVPYVRENLEYKNAAGDTRSIVYMRHGSPTTEGSIGRIGLGMAARGLGRMFGVDLSSITPASGEAIAPDYLEFVDYAREKGQGVFYVIHQRLTENVVENEADRVRALRAIEDSHANFFALVQAVEGDLFEAKDVSFTNTPPSFDTLKARLLEAFTDPSEASGCALPKAMDQDTNYKNTVLPGLLEDVHRIFFAGRTEITSLEEWQNFIQLFYIFQKLDLKFRLGQDAYPVHYYATVCKDCLDRGGNMALVEEIIHDYMLGQENDPDVLIDRVYNILGAPIFVKKKEMVPSRLRPGIALGKYLHSYFTDHADKKAELIAYKFGDGQWKPDGILIHKVEGQTAVPQEREHS